MPFGVAHRKFLLVLICDQLTIIWYPICSVFSGKPEKGFRNLRLFPCFRQDISTTLTLVPPWGTWALNPEKPRVLRGCETPL